MLQPVGRNKNGAAEFWEFSWILPGWSRRSVRGSIHFGNSFFPVSLSEARTPEDPDAHQGAPLLEDLAPMMTESVTALTVLILILMVELCKKNKIKFFDSRAGIKTLKSNAKDKSVIS